jgi:hypothetical protein
VTEPFRQIAVYGVAQAFRLNLVFSPTDHDDQRRIRLSDLPR